MPKFIVVHALLPTPLGLDQAVPLLKRLAGAMTAEAYWIESWCKTNAEGKATQVMCRWDATNPQVVREAVAKYMPDMPVEGVYPLLTIDSGDFR